MLGVSKDTVYKAVENEELGAVRISSRVIITRTHLVEFVGSEDVAEDLIAHLDDGDDE